MARFDDDGGGLATRSDEERSLRVSVARIETLTWECGLGFALVGACGLVLALSARLSLGAGAFSTLMLAFGGWFLVLGGLFHATRELWLARLAALGWLVLVLPLVCWYGVRRPIAFIKLFPLALAPAIVPIRAVEELARHRQRLAAAIAAAS